jgi:uncharacterized membrane-anchored protein YhcB (DUF1043 family)
MNIIKLLSLLIGFVTGYIIIKFIRPSTIVHGPDSNLVKRQIHIDQQTKQCYRFIPQPYVCPLTISTSH